MRILEYNPQLRLNSEQIISHPWNSKEIPPVNKVQVELKQRKLEQQEDIENKDTCSDLDEFEEGYHNIVSRGIGSDDDDEEPALIKECDVYIKESQQPTDFFTSQKPHILMGALGNFVEDKA